MVWLIGGLLWLGLYVVGWYSVDVGGCVVDFGGVVVVGDWWYCVVDFWFFWCVCGC